MSDLIISVEGLGKRYRLRHQATAPYSTLRESLALKARTLLAPRRAHPTRLSTEEDFWALKDVYFEIKRGDVVGIIGRNGAGKSTLLKLLSRITEPTMGRIRLRGRVASLLEVGTGFHPELTGRENIFLNGAILGMTKTEIRSKFDEIVAFAEVEKFLDTPVKHYSSGMYVRLAFAVAAHLEPEILIIDEVLAVGDSQFQQKCLQKMNAVAGDGRTVLFVSHNMAAVASLCTRALLLSDGSVKGDGGVAAVLADYQSRQVSGSTRNRPTPLSQSLFISSIKVSLNTSANPSPLTIELEIVSQQSHRPAFVAFDILGSNGVCVMQALPATVGFIPGGSGTHKLSVVVDLPPLIPGRYSISAWAGSHFNETLDFAENVADFEVMVSPTPGRTVPHSSDHGFIVPVSEIAAFCRHSSVAEQT